MPEEAVTVSEVARYLKVHPNTVYRRAVDGQLPGFRVGRAWRFFLSEIDAKRNDRVDPWVNTKKPRGRRPAN